MTNVGSHRVGTYFSGTGLGYEVAANLQGADEKVLDGVWMHGRVAVAAGGLCLSQWLPTVVASSILYP